MMKDCLPSETRAYYIKGLLYDASYTYIAFFQSASQFFFTIISINKKREESPKNVKHS